MGIEYLLVMDACIVIELFNLGQWGRFLTKKVVILTRKVIEECESIDLEPDIQAGRVIVADLTDGDHLAFRDQFDWPYLGEIDPGESESLAFLSKHQHENYRVCSADHIVYRVLGLLGLGELGLSLETLLKCIGLGRSLPSQFSEAFRKEWTQKGQEDRIRERGFRR